MGFMGAGGHWSDVSALSAAGELRTPSKLWVQPRGGGREGPQGPTEKRKQIRTQVWGRGAPAAPDKPAPPTPEPHGGQTGNSCLWRNRIFTPTPPPSGQAQTGPQLFKRAQGGEPQLGGCPPRLGQVGTSHQLP